MKSETGTFFTLRRLFQVGWDPSCLSADPQSLTAEASLLKDWTAEGSDGDCQNPCPVKTQVSSRHETRSKSQIQVAKQQEQARRMNLSSMKTQGKSQNLKQELPTDL